jgi:hypothetical protein
MKLDFIRVAIFAGLVGTTTPLAAGDWSQLIAAAGLTTAEAQGMTLTELHAYQINRGSPRAAERVTVAKRSYPAFDARAHGQLVVSARENPEVAYGMSLSDIAAAKLNLGSDPDDRIPVLPERTVEFSPSRAPQLVAAAGLTPEEAAGMTLTEIYVRKINREARGDDRQGPAD